LLDVVDKDRMTFLFSKSNLVYTIFSVLKYNKTSKMIDLSNFLNCQVNHTAKPASQTF
jgi:hypothetical protein